ncbi:TetR/AcrR family transcriptional regulator [Antrihabitans cavernicola]|uniref:TetR/AcrR family transcriptional regulator n=1 Tax=Antrihabitans cavernicola TaxID=2495913 RepID=A0A5A7SC08_9NOCA|nr:TetR/AcrR family transcriptional regulator [Spelaeibacter cavernicola]KAA0022015.1 TetR/AcrR family transcriptional regulator [Spelaeibacter cavernicola]
MKTTRQYTMRARADATNQTRERILQATYAASETKPIAAIVLLDVAELAGVSVQTILRQFGSRDGLLDATVEYAVAQVDDERATTPGDPEAALKVLLDHYEKRGDAVIRLLCQESWDERVRAITDAGRDLHRRWVSGVFESLIENQGRSDTSEVIDLLVVATDVYTWKLLRRDRGLSRAATQRRMQQLVTSLLKG